MFWKAEKYMYVPVSNLEFRKQIEGMNEGRKTKGKKPYNLIIRSDSQAGKVNDKLSTGLLRSVSASDRLYVAAHGIPQSDRIGCTLDNGERRYSKAPEFAQHLKNEGLHTNFVDLRILSCYSGIAPNRNGFTEPFAESLAKELRKIGFLKIKVTGYLGIVQPLYLRRSIAESIRFTPETHKGVWSEKDKEYYAASARKVVF